MLIFCRPGQSQGLLYKHLHDSLVNLAILYSQQLYGAAMHKRLRIAFCSYKIDYFIVIRNFLNPEGYQNCITASKVTAIYVKG